MIRPLLSICIPTYNRAEYLKNCLESISCQFDNPDIKNLVEIVISDNNSQDNTFKISEEYRLKFSNIKYFKNQENIGMDANIENSIIKASGKYCWSIGDDDLIQNGALGPIINALLKKDVALLTVDFFSFSDTKKSVKKINFQSIFPEYSNSAEDFYNKGFCQGILGIFIFNKDLWLKLDRTNCEKYWGYYELALKIAGTSILPLAHLKIPAIYNGQDYRWNKGGTSFFITIHNKKMLEKLSEFGYSKNFIKKEIDILTKKFLKTIISAKSFGLNCSFSNLSLVFKEFKDYPVSLFFTALIFFIPNFFFKTAKKIIGSKNV